MTEPTLPQNLTACRHFNSAALVKIVVVSVCHGGLLFHRSTSVQSTVSTTALTVASSTRSASASSAATVLR